MDINPALLSGDPLGTLYQTVPGDLEVVNGPEVNHQDQEHLIGNNLSMCLFSVIMDLDSLLYLLYAYTTNRENWSFMRTTRYFVYLEYETCIKVKSIRLQYCY